MNNSEMRLFNNGEVHQAWNGVYSQVRFFFGKESGSRSGKGAVTEDTQRRRVPRI